MDKSANADKQLVNVLCADSGGHLCGRDARSIHKHRLVRFVFEDDGNVSGDVRYPRHIALACHFSCLRGVSRGE